eukprot:TRINITY_DN4724_c0_g1_i1.p1 TRINITY_DN4724_c0_g1~~TRINITY_DN4724_c0_g1_i1.p1  ORF type:complete len:448 (-),score=83.53 TRINITY_DN4724_c0_g1_i1:145-1488(-)
MKLVAGSYERFLFGYTVKGLLKKEAEGEGAGDKEGASGRTVSLTADFNHAAHMGPVKCLAASGSVLASGGMDDIVKVYDLKASKDMGSLMQHDGAITCLKFHGPRGHPTHLFSGGADSNICVWDADEWMHLQTLKGHRSYVNDMTVHHTGRLLLSVARDGLLKMWDLIKGRCTYTTRLAEEGELVAFMPQSGKEYTLATGSNVKLFSAESGKEIGVLQHERKVLCMAQTQDNVLVTGTDGGLIEAWDVSSRNRIFSWADTHAVRVRAVVILPSPGAGETSQPSMSQMPPPLIASTSTDGFIRVWDTRKGGSSGSKPSPLAEVQTEARLTSLVCSGGGGQRRVSDRAAKLEQAPRASARDAGEKDDEPRGSAGLQKKSEQNGKKAPSGGDGRGLTKGLGAQSIHNSKSPQPGKGAGKRGMDSGKGGGKKARRLLEQGSGQREGKKKSS